jgi:FtsZ-binding cell division protein ZapB
MEEADKIQHCRDKIKEIDLQISELKRSRGNYVREMSNISRTGMLERAKNRHIKSVNTTTTKQDYIVNLLRVIGRPATCGEICDSMLPKLHSSKFSAKYASAIKEDARIVIENTGPKRRIYYLSEWTVRKAPCGKIFRAD